MATSAKATNDEKRRAYTDLLKAAKGTVEFFQQGCLEPTKATIDAYMAQLVVLKVAVQTCERLMGGR